MNCRIARAARTLVLFTFIAAVVRITVPLSAAEPSKQEFSLDASQWNDKPKSVAVAGDFNGWSKDANPLKSVGGNVWKGTVPLVDGLHHYKFVIDGNRWITDPKADSALEEDDNFGGRNSGIIAGASAAKLPPPEPNKINPDGVIFHANDVDDVNVYDAGKVRLRVRAQANDVQSVNAILGGGAPMPLAKLSSDRGFDVFAGTVEADGDSSPLAIQLVDGTATKYAAAKGLSDSPAPVTISLKPNFATPAWAKRAVWYQIFPERFRNGETANDPGDKEFEHLEPWTSNWWATLKNETPGSQNFYSGAGNVWKRRYGGDIQGIQKELPYLRSLGVTAIYLNPIFEADSMHKYDTTDYRHVDQHFGVRGDLPIAGETEDPSTWKWSGSDKVFLDFVAEAHRQGFKVLCDGVFNHVGRANIFFQDVVKNGRSSKYASWFDIQDFGNKSPADPEIFGKPGGMKFKAWDGDSGNLPILKKDDVLGLVHGPREHVLAIAKRWLAPDGDASKGIDGFRLDVPGDIPHPFWLEFRKVVKSTKPDAYISGEIWPWAQAWLNSGDQFDAVMNYQFAYAAQEFFVNQRKALPPTKFNDRLATLELNYPFQVALDQMNLFDSHDTDRAASMYVNPDLTYDSSNRIQDNGPNYNPRKPNATEWARMRQAVAFQMSFVGAPMIYYGDECGMWGPDDPSDREPMVWKDLEPYDDPEVKFDQTQFDHYQRAIAVRAALPALQTGFCSPIFSDDEHGVEALVRTGGKQPVYVVMNRSGSPQHVELPMSGDNALIDWMDPKQASVKPSDSPDGRPMAIASENNSGVRPSSGKLSLDLQPYQTMILAAEK